MSRRYRERKDRREAWYHLTVSIWDWTREAERGYALVPPPPHPDNYHLLPVTDIREFYSFPKEEWDERVSRLAP